MSVRFSRASLGAEPILVRPAVLLLLRGKESHGSALVHRLADLGVEVPTMAGLYRMLRGMDNEGLVTFHWITPGKGPARRVYTLTEAGEARLDSYMMSLASLVGTIRGMLNRYRQGSRDLER